MAFDFAKALQGGMGQMTNALSGGVKQMTNAITGGMKNMLKPAPSKYGMKFVPGVPVQQQAPTPTAPTLQPQPQPQKRNALTGGVSDLFDFDVQDLGQFYAGGSDFPLPGVDPAVQLALEQSGITLPQQPTAQPQSQLAGPPKVAPKKTLKP